MKSALLRIRRFRLAAGVVVLMLTALFQAREARAVLQLISDDGDGSTWPAEAPVRTSAAGQGGATRGVRGNREQFQTFSVTDAFSLDKLFIEYEWALEPENEGAFPWEENPTKLTLYEITRTYDSSSQEVSFTLGNVVIAETSFVVNGTDKVHLNRYSMELQWDAATSGELILQPRTGNEGYALKFNGTLVGPGSSAIAVVTRGDDPYPFGRTFETGQFASGLFDIPLILTAVPEATLDGDYNSDGKVDTADYVTWRKLNPTDLMAYGTWVANFGTSSSESGGANVSSAVPEPAAGLLIVFVVIWFNFTRPR